MASKKSTILRGMTKDGTARFLVINSTSMVNKMIKTHKTAPTATAALGRLISAASMIGTLLPENGNSITMQTISDGPISSMVAVADYFGNVKGYINGADADPKRKPNGKLDVSAAVGAGTLNVVKDAGKGVPSCATTQLVSGEIAEDIATYFAESEQIPTLLSLGVLVDVDYSCKAAGGVLIQLMPFPDEQTVSLLERNAQDLSSVSRLISEGMTNEQIAEIALRDIPYDFFDTLEVDLKCNCTRARLRKKLRALGEDQLKQLLDEQEADDGTRALTANCRFCAKEYRYEEQELIGSKK